MRLLIYSFYNDVERVVTSWVSQIQGMLLFYNWENYAATGLSATCTTVSHPWDHCLGHYHQQHITTGGCFTID